MTVEFYVTVRCEHLVAHMEPHREYFINSLYLNP